MIISDAIIPNILWRSTEAPKSSNQAHTGAEKTNPRNKGIEIKDCLDQGNPDPKKI